ncbi:hypothetical protein K439DRAFT_979501 [Ramaria rubella]|nr:hypothetical protein K439DRAFT_979501 [Ramaria rubella]
MVNWRDSIRSFGTETQFKYTRLVISESLRRITVCVLMILQTLFIRFSPENTNFFTAPFILPIEAILVSRFLLDLHAATAKHIDLTTSYDTSFSEITRDRRRGQSAGVHVDLLESDVTLIVQSLPFTP